MIITDHLNQKAIMLDLKATSKEEVLSEMLCLLISTGEVNTEEKSRILKALEDREKISSTGIGYGIAIPHAKSPAVKTATITIGFSKNGIDFNSLDGKPTHFFFLILASPNHEALYLKILARISRFVKDREFRKLLSESKTSEKIYEIIKDKEEKDRIQ